MIDGKGSQLEREILMEGAHHVDTSRVRLCNHYR